MAAPLINKVRVMYWLVLLNIIASCAILYPLVIGESIISTLMGAVFIHMALLSQITLALLLISLSIVIITMLIPSSDLFVLLSTFSYGLLQCFLVIDVYFYSIFKSHVNDWIFNILPAPNTLAVLQISKQQFIIGGAIMIFILLSEFFALKSIRYCLTLRLLGSYKKKLAPLIIFTVLINIIDKGLFAIAKDYNITAITQNAKLIPFYQAVQIKRPIKVKSEQPLPL